MKTAVITGVNGQDGAYLSHHLLSLGYEVIGVHRRSSIDTLKRLRLVGVLDNANFSLVEADVSDFKCMLSLLYDFHPDEFYNLAAQSHVATSFKQPDYTWKVNAEGVQNILEAIKNINPSCRFYQASTSEMFGSQVDPDGFQRESTQLSPNSPYAIAKVAAHHNVRLYREAYGLHASSGILFNHESYLRGEFFVTKKITKWISSYQHNRGSVEPLRLGNLKAYRDWGFAGDYVKAMHLMLQQDNPDDYVVATGDTHTVEDFLDEAFKLVGVSDWSKLVLIDESLKRPCEVPMLRGDSTKARDVLGWKPTVNFQELIKKMVFNHVF